MNNKHLVSGFIALFALTVLAACGGGGGGGGGSAGVATGEFTKAFNPDPTNSNVIPFGSGGAGDVKYQQLYTPAEINGSGPITMLRFRRQSLMASAVTCPNTTIRLGHTSLAALVATFASNINEGRGSQATVFNNATLTIPAGAAGEWFDVPFSTPFYYNNVDNLVVEIERTTTCSDTVWVQTVAGAAGVRVQSSEPDTTPGTAQHDPVTGETVDTSHPLQQFVFAGGDNEVIAADGFGGVAAFIAPGTGGRTQFLLLASDIVGSGPITGIQFQAAAALTAPANATYQVTLSHVAPATTTINSTTFANNVGSNARVVAQDVSVHLPEGTTRWWIPLNGSFNYDGTSNLLVDVVATVPFVDGFSILYQSTAAGQRVLFNNSIFVGLPAVGEYPLAPRGLEPKLRFAGGTVDIINGNPNSDVARWFTANAANAIDQHLYLASELGTGGSIHRMACRKLSAIVTMATDYTNFEVVMAHTTETTLDTTYASNLINPVTVFNGTYALPENLHQGDWIEIPFTTPFNYNAAQNLVIQVKSDPGANPYACSLTSSATQFPARRVTDGPRDALVGSSYNHLKDIRLWINR